MTRLTVILLGARHLGRSEQIARRCGALFSLFSLRIRPRMWRLMLGEADKQVGRYAGAGDNSYRSSVVKPLAGLAADPWALDIASSSIAVQNG